MSRDLFSLCVIQTTVFTGDPSILPLVPHLNPTILSDLTAVFEEAVPHGYADGLAVLVGLGTDVAVTALDENPHGVKLNDLGIVLNEPPYSNQTTIAERGGSLGVIAILAVGLHVLGTRRTASMTRERHIVTRNGVDHFYMTDIPCGLTARIVTCKQEHITHPQNFGVLNLTVLDDDGCSRHQW